MAQRLLWINKTADSASLSHSDDVERLRLLSQAQRVSRIRAGKVHSGGKSAHARRHGKGAKEANGFPRRLVARLDIEPSCNLCHTSLDELSLCDHHKHQAYRKRLSKRTQYPINFFPSLDPSWTIEERRGVDYFLRATVLKIITIHSDAGFWKEIVPCMAELHPAFRHLVVAIAATHELLLNANAQNLNILALEQCNKATHLLLSSCDLTHSWLIISCILVSAYKLLRCDLIGADLSIESGLKMVERIEESLVDISNPPRADVDENLKMILLKLGRQHGFKLWAPDLVCQFDKTNLAKESFQIETKCVVGPFLGVGQVLASFRTLLEIVTKVLRNLARGAYVDPSCPFAQALSDELSEFHYFLELYYNQLTQEDYDERLELKQVLVAFLCLSMIVRARLVGSGEPILDAQYPRQRSIIRLAEDIVAARLAGHQLKYVDRMVCGALFTVGLGCREPNLRRQAISLLQSQSTFNDGLVNWLRGMLVQMVAETEERGLNVQRVGVPASNRIHLVSGQCEDDKAIVLQYAEATAPTEAATHEMRSEWPASFGLDLSAREIDDTLQGIMSAYSMYRKLDGPRAPQGYGRPMYYRGQPVKVLWEEAFLAQQQD